MRFLYRFNLYKAERMDDVQSAPEPMGDVMTATLETARKSLPAPASEREILQNYLDDIYDTPVLETEEQHDLFVWLKTHVKKKIFMRPAR